VARPLMAEDTNAFAKPFDWSAVIA
jgi:hypothetical protein